MTHLGKRTIAICVACGLVGLLLAQGSFTDDGGSAWDIAGWAVFVLALIVGLVTAVLSDRSNLSDRVPGGKSRRLPRPGLIATSISALLALITLAGFAHEFDPMQCSNTEIKASGQGSYTDYSIDSSNTRALPPGRVCREFGIVRRQDGTWHHVFVGEKVIPSTRDYLIALLVILAPLAVSTGWRARQVPPDGTLPADTAGA